jgi:hypothetical protein
MIQTSSRVTRNHPDLDAQILRCGKARPALQRSGHESDLISVEAGRVWQSPRNMASEEPQKQ